MRIDEACIRYIVSVERPTRAPAPKDTPTDDNRTQGNETDAERENTHEGNTQMEEKNVANAPLEYAVNNKVRDVGKGDSVKYVVGW